MAIDNIHGRKEEKEKINIHDPFELRNLSSRYGVKKEDILEAIRSEGDTKDAVEKYLKEKKAQLYITT